MSSDRNLLSRIKGKSLKTLVVRGSQEARLAALAATGGWKRLTRAIDAHWGDARVEKYAGMHVLVNETASAALAKAFQEGLLDREALIGLGAAVRARRFKILHHAVPRSGDFPWNADWRFDHVYPFADFRRYDHHSARDIPYDVKYPWELSRLGFLLPLMQEALLENAIGEASGQLEEVFSILADFDAKNPYARSVNWQPMEVSMRGITLVFLLEIALQAQASRAMKALLLKMISRHGEFLWRNIEYTDNRGNHYAANIVALLVMGAALSGHYGPALRWQFYAVAHIEEEILRQFLPDGVNFEKSTSYHKLVAELFLLAKIVMNRQRLKLGEEAERRLHEACHFAATARRPDGLMPVWGDTDDASLFALDGASPRDPAALLSLGAVLFEDPELKGAFRRQHVSSALPWILGLKGVESFVHLASRPFTGARHFQQGGFIVVRENNNYLMQDAGEVGQNGLGGHGHNDLCSFELCLEGHPFIVDPGCPSYTGDKLARKLFRSTPYHNMSVIDSAEIAEITGPFRIANTALPKPASCTQVEKGYIIVSGHGGYETLASPVFYERKIFFDPDMRNFSCDDIFKTAGRHHVDRYFHFARGVTLQPEGKAAVAMLYQHRFLLSFDDYSVSEILPGRVSEGYGHAAEAEILKLSTEITADVTLSFCIKKI